MREPLAVDRRREPVVRALARRGIATSSLRRAVAAALFVAVVAIAVGPVPARPGTSVAAQVPVETLGAIELAASAPLVASTECQNRASPAFRPAERVGYRHLALSSGCADEARSPISPAPAPGDPAASTACTVSILLVPSCGAWLGAATTDAAMKWDYRVGLAEYEAVAANAPDIQHFYMRNGTPFPTATQISLAHRPGQQRSLMLINWKPSTTHTWRQIANGEADHLIASVAGGMRAYPQQFFLTIWHEPENDFGPGRQPADYVAMYRHVVEQLRVHGVSNVVYVWNMMGYSGHSHLYDSLYPGHDVVDWVAWDPYATKEGVMLANMVNENCCKVPNWTGFYDWAVRKAPGKPLMLAEWGFDLNRNSQGPASLDGGAALLRSQFPLLKALVFYNENNQNGNKRIDTNSALGRALGEAYRRFANDPYFNSTPTSAAP